MGAKLISWLGRLSWLSKSGDNNRPVPALSTHFYQQLAFELATVTDLAESLPALLTPLQKQLDITFGSSQQYSQQRSQECQLYLFFNAPMAGERTSESFVQHTPDIIPPPGLAQKLRQAFTTLHAEARSDIRLTLSGQQTGEVQASILADYQDYTVWYVLLFNQRRPPGDTIDRQISAMKDALAKGLSACSRLQQKIDDAIQTERTIHAAELHDSLAQILGYLRIKSAQLNSQCQAKQYSELKPVTEDLAAYTHCAYRQTRELITASRLSMHGQNLTQAVINSVTEFERQSGIVFELDNRLLRNITTPKQALQILYIIREALSNVVRHSHASHARVILRALMPSSLQIQIEDNGIGIDSHVEKMGSFGLRIMQERAERIAAKLAVVRRDHGGTRVELTVPVGEQT